MILAEPSVQAAVPKIPVNPAKIVSAEDIEEKLKAAEERRLVSQCFVYLFWKLYSWWLILWRLVVITINFCKFFIFQQLEAKKIDEWNAKQAKIEEASRKKEELDKEFAAQTKEALEAKMEQYEEKREALISDMKEKLKVFFV